MKDFNKINQDALKSDNLDQFKKDLKERDNYYRDLSRDFNESEENPFKVIHYVLMAIGVVCVSIFPLAYWFANPELTQMQVLIELWYVILTGVCCLFMSLFK